MTIDLKHIYIDGSKFEASSNKYAGMEEEHNKNPDIVCMQITQLLNQINDQLTYFE